MLGWIKVLKKKFNKMSALKQFLIAAVIIVVVRYILKMIIYSNYTFSYLENLENPTSAVYFHMNGCGHCKTLMPEWDAAAKENKTGVTMRSVEMNEDDGPKLCKKHDITGFPTMLVLENGKKVKDYNGERNKKGLLDFLNNL